jgi:prepilin-type N-terminal cleavage/methylation domain-containing protein
MVLRKNIYNLSRGFTLVELLVSISVMAVILGISLSGGPQAIMRLSLSDNTYQTELLVREVQLQGSAINSVDDIFGGSGVFFDLATSSQALKFRDRVDPTLLRAIGVGDGLYESSPVDEYDSLLKMTNRNTIAKLCVATSSSPLYCNGSNVPPIKTLTISFSRPRQIAHIYINGTTSVDYNEACVEVDSLQAPTPGYVRAIEIYKSGMITKKVGVCN